MPSDFENLCAFETLYAAHCAARRGKRHKSDVIRFEADLANQLWTLKTDLESGRYTVGGYKRFVINDPKTREIQALSYADRVVQHALCDKVLAPFFEKRLIYDNCACRVGKGTGFGVARLSAFLREHYRRYGARGWILKADVRQYFPSIDHAVLLSRLRRHIPDPRIMALLETIIDSFHGAPGKGLPMGNQTSQWFALYYLDPIDRLVKEQRRVPHYTRYMDDMVLLSPDKADLQECLRQMREKCRAELRLELNQKTQIFPLENGVDYLGWHFYLTPQGKVVRALRTAAKQRLKRRLKKLQYAYAMGELDIPDIKCRVAAGNGHLKRGHTWHLRKRLYGKTVFQRRAARQ
ncbi:MAG: RNA-directed DNA polymerase [Candidatus Accumulibacter sp.]|jgi:retron-type reverse transcriptase|nr:RNA-directed DNA polymerase [Accumulibacter sp.]